MAIDFPFYATLPFTDKNYTNVQRVIEKNVFALEKDGRTVTLLTGHQISDFPIQLLQEAFHEFNLVIEEGRTYPFSEAFTFDTFIKYLLEGFAAVLVEGEYTAEWDAKPQKFWHECFLGYFYVKPNYVGRSSHVCNGGFVVNHSRRGLGLGKEMGLQYLSYAPRLGYVYSVFNLVYETNTASCRIWDSLGFQRIGYIKNVAVLKGEDNFVGAYMYGKDLQDIQGLN